jgi:hypothetical protein
MLGGSNLPRARGRRQGRRVDPQLRPRESSIAAPIHPSAWKRNSANFAFTEVSDVGMQHPA